jgi:ABC-type antimicrobial peptide transport system permease subunit
LLNAPQPDGAIPAILDANSLTYVMHKAVGDVIEIPHPDGAVTLRVVAALRDSLFQSEILIADEPFRRLFPHIEGYRFFLIDPASSSNDHLAADIEDRLSAFAVDVLPSEDRLTEFHRVENTYLATFQTLGGLGLLVGTLGLSAVLLRNVVERRRELALLGAVGYRPRHVGAMLFAESGSLLTAGLAIGAAAACVASLPAFVERGGRLPFSTVGLVVVGSVLIAGLLATALAARAATRRPLLSALRSE